MIRAELDVVLNPGRPFSHRQRVRAEGLEVVETRKSGAIVCALCRRLIEAGHDPAVPMEVYRGQTLALRVRSIGEGARRTVVEEPRPHFTRYTPPKTLQAPPSQETPGG
jgi:hypothetical protein